MMAKPPPRRAYNHFGTAGADGGEQAGGEDVYD